MKVIAWLILGLMSIPVVMTRVYASPQAATVSNFVVSGSTSFPPMQNDSIVGTTLYTLTKQNSSGNLIIAATSDTSGIVGVTVNGAGTAGEATVTNGGTVPILFDTPPLAGDFVGNSPTISGYAHDFGTSVTSVTTQCIGRVGNPATQVLPDLQVYNVIWINCGGVQNVPIATTTQLGVIKPDGSSITCTGGGTCSATPPPIATTSLLGVFKPDGTTITCTGGGVCSSVGGSGSGSGIPYAADTSGAANTITAAPAAPILSYGAGYAINVLVANESTGAVTLAVSGLTAQPVYRVLSQGKVLAGATDVQPGITYTFTYQPGGYFLMSRAPDFTALFDCAVYPNSVVGAPTGGATTPQYFNGDMCFNDAMQYYLANGGPGKYLGLAFKLPPGTTQTANYWVFPYPGSSATVTSQWKVPKVSVAGVAAGEFSHSSVLQATTATPQLWGSAVVMPGTQATWTYYTTGVTTPPSGCSAGSGTQINCPGTSLNVVPGVLSFPWLKSNDTTNFPDTFWDDVKLQDFTVDGNALAKSCWELMAPREPTVYNISCKSVLPVTYWGAIGYINAAFKNGTAPSGFRSQGLDADIQNVFMIGQGNTPQDLAVLTANVSGGAITGYNILATGPVDSATVANGGTGWTVGDYFRLTNGDGRAAFTVKTVSGSTVATATQVYDGSTGYSTATAQPTASITCASGTCSGLTMNVVGAVTNGGRYKNQLGGTLPIRLVGVGAARTRSQPCTTMPTYTGTGSYPGLGNPPVAQVSSGGVVTGTLQTTNGSGCDGVIYPQVTDVYPSLWGFVMGTTDSTVRHVRANAVGTYAFASLVGASNKFYDIHPVNTPYGIYDTGNGDYSNTECDTMTIYCIEFHQGKGTKMHNTKMIWLSGKNYPGQAGSGQYYFFSSDPTNLGQIGLISDYCGNNQQDSGGYNKYVMNGVGPLEAQSQKLNLTVPTIIDAYNCTTPFVPAQVKPTVAGGIITGYTVSNAGANGPYATAPALANIGPNTTAAGTPTALLAGDAVVAVTGGGGGTGYSSASATASVDGIAYSPNMFVDTGRTESVITATIVNNEMVYAIRNSNGYAQTPYLLATLPAYTAGTGAYPALVIDAVLGTGSSTRTIPRIAFENNATAPVVAGAASYYTANGSIIFTGLTGLSSAFTIGRSVTFTGFSSTLAFLNNTQLNVLPTGISATQVDVPFNIITNCTSVAPCTDSGTITQYPLGYQWSYLGGSTGLSNIAIQAYSESDGSTNIYVAPGAFSAASIKVSLKQDPNVVIRKNPVQQLDTGQLVFDSSKPAIFSAGAIGMGPVIGTTGTYSDNINALSIMTAKNATFGTAANAAVAAIPGSGYVNGTMLPTTSSGGVFAYVDVTTSGGGVSLCNISAQSGGGGQYFGIGDTLHITATGVESGSDGLATCTVTGLSGQVTTPNVFAVNYRGFTGLPVTMIAPASQAFIFGAAGTQQWTVSSNVTNLGALNPIGSYVASTFGVNATTITTTTPATLSVGQAFAGTYIPPFSTIATALTPGPITLQASFGATTTTLALSGGTVTVGQGIIGTSIPTGALITANLGGGNYSISPTVTTNSSALTESVQHGGGTFTITPGLGFSGTTNTTSVMTPENAIATYNMGSPSNYSGNSIAGNFVQCTGNTVNSCLPVGGLSFTLGAPTLGTGVTSATCALTTNQTGCTNLRWTYSVVTGTFTTGTLFSLAWTTTSTPYSCWVSQNGGTAFYGIGHSLATSTGMNITSSVTPAGATVLIDGGCLP